MIARMVNLFWLWTLLGTAWAWLVPEHFTWFVDVVPGTDIKMVTIGLGVIMLGMGITLTFEDFRKVMKMPRAVGLGVLAQFLIMPFIGWTIATLFSLPDQFKLGIILVSCCPGGTASNVVTYLARGNLALSVLMTMCSTLLAVFLTPFLTKAYASAILPVDGWAMVLTMVMVVLLPVVGGLLINRFLGDKLKAVKNIAPLISVLVIVLIVGAIIGKTKGAIELHWQTLIPAMFLLHVIGFSMGYLWARFFGLLDEEKKTFSIEVGMQNSGLGATLAGKHFSSLAATPCAISAFFHCMIGSFLASIWSRKESQKGHNHPQ